MKKRILLAPLDWGLGHATRLIPVIRMAMQLGAEPVIGGSGGGLALLCHEFPQLQSVELPSYRIVYPSGQSMVWQMLKLMPRILTAIRDENHELRTLVNTLNIKAVISDNRFGLHHPAIPSVFITHQLFIKSTPGFFWAEPVIKKLNHHYINQFNECWIPDVPASPGLSGTLSHKPGQPQHWHFIGPLSRFNYEVPVKCPQLPVEKYHYLAILSGPEPQRSHLEEILKNQLLLQSESSLIIRGIPEKEREFHTSDYPHRVNHLSSNELQYYLEQAEVIICRSGYSSIMDLAALGKQAILVPTPGQTEQEYLAKLHDQQGHSVSANQSNFQLRPSVKSELTQRRWPNAMDDAGLKQRMQALIGKL